MIYVEYDEYNFLCNIIKWLYIGWFVLWWCWFLFCCYYFKVVLDLVMYGVIYI